MEADGRLGHNDASVIFERFGEEVVAIHLKTGCYYSLPAVAGDAFLLLSGAPSLAALSQALSLKYDAPPQKISDDLPKFLHEMKEEGLIIEHKQVDETRTALPLDHAGPRLPYTPPALHPHRDLENLFLVDPVHDAGEAGWPEVKKAVENEKPARYRFPPERCMFERFDEATIALNLNTGAYFSFSGPAEDILLLLPEVPTKAEIVGALQTKYDVPLGQLADAVAHFLKRLSDVDLLLAEDLETDPEVRSLILAKPGEGLAFEPPDIEIFRDAPALVMDAADSDPGAPLLSGKRKFRLNKAESMVSFVDDGAIAVQLIRGTYFVFNATAARVLRMLEKEPTPSEIVADLERDYDLRRPELVAAVIVLLRNLIGIGLATAEAANPDAPGTSSPPADQRPKITFEPFAVDLRYELREQICFYPGGQVLPKEPASRGRRLAMALEEYFDEASSRSQVTETKMVIAGRAVQIRCIGDVHSRHLALALSHLPQEFDSKDALTLHVWDGESGGTPSDTLLASYLANLHRDWMPNCGPRGQLKGFHSAEVPSFYMPGPDVLNLLDIANKKAFFFKKDATVLPYWEAGSPFRTLLHCWLSGAGLQFVHGGAVGGPDGGVLLAGRGGSGKSTTALLCLHAGMMYAGDDYCGVDCNGPLYLHSLYNTAKLLPPDVDRFPEMRENVWNPHALAENSPDKATFFLGETLPERMSLGFPLKAILLPRVGPHRDTYTTPCGAGAALAALAPSTISQLPGSGQADMERLAKICSELPAYILHLGSDLAQIPGVVRSVLR